MAAPGASRAKTAPGPSPARRVAHTVLRRTFDDGAYADRALSAEAQRAGLPARERALATRLAFGAVQRRATLDHLIGKLSDRPVADLDAAVRDALRLGILQLAFFDSIPDHAAVGESVALAKSPHGGGHTLVNAVLRRATRELPALLDALDDSTPAGAAIVHSHPEWVVRMWWDTLGPEQTRQLLHADNQPAESALRANTLVTSPEKLAQRLTAEHGLAVRRDARLPESLIVDGAFDAHGSPLWDAGAFMPQSRAASAVAHVVAPQPDEAVLDLCAAPGGKTTHLAALMEGRGRVDAVERHPRRAAALEATCQRMGAKSVSVLVDDAAAARARTYDRVLVDPPCSGLGTLQARPDARWRTSPGDIDELVALQSEILAAGAQATAPGGTLVYSSCTISPAENEDRIAALLAARPDFEVEDLSSDFPLWKHPTMPRYLLTLPHRDETAGFFVARLRRTAS